MNVEEFIPILAGMMEADAADIQPDTEYQELEEWSSVTAMTLIAFAKTQFGKTITGQAIRRAKTVEELLTLITAQ
ncbi:MAG: acyl carrier protein [Prevotella sp.]|nr:acyl carrier protein [Prevotella sp.]